MNLLKHNSSRRYTSEVWSHYTKKDKALALCKYCNKLFSYKSTTANLRGHLKTQHLSAYLVLKENDEERKRLKNLEEHAGSFEDEPSSDKETESNQQGVTWKCSLCRQALMKREDIITHMKEAHPDHDLDQELKVEEDHCYTEVVYLEDDETALDGTSAPEELLQDQTQENTHEPPDQRQVFIVKKRRSTISHEPQRNTSRLRYSENFSEGHQTHSPRGNEEEVVFGKYVTTLLSALSREQSMKLQMDIVNLIVSARLKGSAEQNTNGIDNSGKKYY